MSFALLAAAFMTGLLGSTHCAGMCGPIVSLFESQHAAANTLPPLVRRSAYQLGRMLFYVALGVVVGFLGKTLMASTGVSQAANVLRYVASALLVVIGLRLLFGINFLKRLDTLGLMLWRKLSPLARFVLPMNTIPRAVAAGFLWGAIPCGMVYGVLTLSLSAGNPLLGGLVMMAFWLGTLPLLFGAGGALHLLILKPNTRRAAGLIMTLTGILTIAPAFYTSENDPHHDHHHPMTMTQPGPATATIEPETTP